MTTQWDDGTIRSDVVLYESMIINSLVHTIRCQADILYARQTRSSDRIAANTIRFKHLVQSWIEVRKTDGETSMRRMLTARYAFIALNTGEPASPYYDLERLERETDALRDKYRGKFTCGDGLPPRPTAPAPVPTEPGGLEID